VRRRSILPYPPLVYDDDMTCQAVRQTSSAPRAAAGPCRRADLHAGAPSGCTACTYRQTSPFHIGWRFFPHPPWAPTEPEIFTVELVWPCQVRLDRVLTSALHLSRPKMQQWVKAGRLRVFPERSQVWRKPAQSGQCVVIAPAVRPSSSDTGVDGTRGLDPDSAP
jgi:hypothetical protein